MAFRLLKKNKAHKKDAGNKPENPAITVGVMKPQKFSLKKLKNLSRKKKVIFISVIILILGGGLYAYIWNDADSNVSEDGYLVVCNDELLSRASNALSSDEVQALVPLAQEIQKLPDYDQDPYCLNIVTTYYTRVSDYNNARHHLDKLKAIYQDDHDFKLRLGKDAKNIVALSLTTDFLEAQQQMLEGGVIPSPRVEE